VKLLKTVVGSFPPKKLPLRRAIKWAVDLQLAHGIDLISDGEQRGDMIGYFGFLPGVGIKPTGPYVKSRVLPPEETQKFVKLTDLRFVKEYLKSKRVQDVRVKISVTGPVTLGFACACNGLEYYSGMKDMRLYSDFAEALKPLIEEVAKTECYLQIDEPSLSIRVMDSRNAIKIVNDALTGVPASFYDEEKLAVHVCGPLTVPLFDDLGRLHAPILSLAFSAPNVSENIKIVSKRTLQREGKRLGVGCVSVLARRKEEVESLGMVFKRLDAIKHKVGKETFAFIHPDCGLRNTGVDAVEPILETVSSSAKFLEQMK
jgi:5-methyltetrahydropteroyltriglutamate--homocysteine methyltransferase